MQLVDIGANLTHPAFHADLPEVLTRARHAGVTAQVAAVLSSGVYAMAVFLGGVRWGAWHAEHDEAQLLQELGQRRATH